LAAAGVGALGAKAAAVPSTDPFPDPELARQGPKMVVKGKKAVASSQHPIVTQTMLEVLRSGGNAVDAIVAGAITQATVQLDMTNHTGTVSLLYWEAKTGKSYQLNSMGTLAPNLPPCRPYPPGLGGVAAGPPMACIPGFVPRVGEAHRRFGAKPWPWCPIMMSKPPRMAKKHGEESSPSSTMFWPPFSLLIAVTFSTPTPHYTQNPRIGYRSASDTWSLVNPVRKVEFELLQLKARLDHYARCVCRH
jgi:hypothetical protein